MSDSRTPVKPNSATSTTPLNGMPSRFAELRKNPAELQMTPGERSSNNLPIISQSIYEKDPNRPPNNSSGSSGAFATKPVYVDPALQRHTYNAQQQGEISRLKPYFLPRATLALSLLTAALGLVLLLSSQVTLTGAVIGIPNMAGNWGILFLLAGIGVLGAHAWMHQ